MSQSAYDVRTLISGAGARDEQAAVEYDGRQRVGDATGVAAVQREESVFGFATRFCQPVVQDPSRNACAVRVIEVRRRQSELIVSDLYTVAGEMKHEQSFSSHRFCRVDKAPSHAFERAVPGVFSGYVNRCVAFGHSTDLYEGFRDEFCIVHNGATQWLGIELLVTLVVDRKAHETALSRVKFDLILRGIE